MIFLGGPKRKVGLANLTHRETEGQIEESYYLASVDEKWPLGIINEKRSQDLQVIGSFGWRAKIADGLKMEGAYKK